MLKVAEFLAAVDVAEPLPKKGDRVLGSDHLKIGTVEEVVEATADNPGYIVVPRGLVFERETFIPLDAVVIVGGDVFVNALRLFVAKMPWGEPPTNQTHQAKLGPCAEQVAKLYGLISPSGNQREV